MSEQLGIVELGGVCVTMRSRSLELFSSLGEWVSTTALGELQRLFAEACHRHAWHAELWESRAPVIRVPAPPPPSPQPMDEVTSDEARSDGYRAALSALEDELRSLRARVDPTLDPSTARTIDLVGRDVVELAERLDALRGR